MYVHMYVCVCVCLCKGRNTPNIPAPMVLRPDFIVLISKYKFTSI